MSPVVWKLVQPRARRQFLFLTVVVALGGLVELLGIGTVAQMMKLVASGGESAGNGPLQWAFQALGLEQSGERLKAGWLLSSLVLASVHGYTALRSYLRSRFVWVQDKEISTRLFSSTLQRPYSWFLQRNSAELQHLLLSGTATQRLLGNVLGVISHFAVALTLTLAVLWTDPLVAVSAGLVVCSAYGAVRLGSQRMLGVYGGQAHQAEKARRKIAQEALTSIRFVKTTGRERFFAERFSSLSESASKGMVYHGIYVDVVRAFLEWVSFVGILGLSVYLILQARDFEQLLPRLTLYSMASYRVIPAIHELFGLWSRVEYDRKYLEEIEELLAGPTIEERGPQKPVDLSDSVGLVQLRHVDFFYEGCERQILHDISMEVRRCEWIGIVGTTGAGKSTLLDLLSGLCRPSSGTVTVGRTPLDPECIADWQRRIAVVPQEVILLDDTLLRNVAFGVPDAEIDPARVERVCQDAGLADYLERLPEGYQTRLGERGVRLSGGERQRVGLARALYLQPELLLLDEATSALDQATEGRIVATLRELASACTLITVAHRLTSVKPCDRILVLEQGRIVDQGPYQELLERSPAFRELALLGQSC